MTLDEIRQRLGECPQCGKMMRIMGQCTLSAPAELYGRFSKTNIRRKDVHMIGANWETFDFICECGYTKDACGNYVSRMTKRIPILLDLLDDASFDMTKMIMFMEGVNARLGGTLTKDIDIMTDIRDAWVTRLEGVDDE